MCKGPSKCPVEPEKKNNKKTLPRKKSMGAETLIDDVGVGMENRRRCVTRTGHEQGHGGTYVPRLQHDQYC